MLARTARGRRTVGAAQPECRAVSPTEPGAAGGMRGEPKAAGADRRTTGPRERPAGHDAQDEPPRHRCSNESQPPGRGAARAREQRRGREKLTLWKITQSTLIKQRRRHECAASNKVEAACGIRGTPCGTGRKQRMLTAWQICPMRTTTRVCAECMRLLCIMRICVQVTECRKVRGLEALASVRISVTN